MVPGATLNGTGGTSDLFRGAGSITNSICFIDGGVCEGDGEIDFDDLVGSINFEVGGFNPGDFVVVSAVDGADNVLATLNVASNGAYNFGGLSGISKLLFADTSTGAGFVFGNFNFDVTSAAVPVPAAAPLMLAGLGFLARKRRKQV